MEFSGPALNVDIPNLTVPQFILDSPHELRPHRKDDIPWFIEDGTGRTLCYAEVVILNMPISGRSRATGPPTYARAGERAKFEVEFV